MRAGRLKKAPKLEGSITASAALGIGRVDRSPIGGGLDLLAVRAIVVLPPAKLWRISREILEKTNPAALLDSEH